MRFCRLFPLRSNPRDGENALAHHTRIRAKSRVQCDHPHPIVLFPRTIFPEHGAPPAGYKENLTEFLFGPKFSKPDPEGL
jgi:hypothetical protein